MANTSGTNLLGQETTYQLRLFDLATNAAEVGVWNMACFWAKQYALFVGCRNLPSEPVLDNKTTVAIHQYEDYFKRLIGTGLSDTKKNIETIRAIYARKAGLPKIEREMLTTQVA